MFGIVLAWEAFKDWLAHTAHLTHWDLHVLVGLVLFVVFARIMRRPITSAAPLLPLALLEALNEVFDFTRYYVSGWSWQGKATLVEVALTLGPPLVLIAIARCWPYVRGVKEAVVPKR